MTTTIATTIAKHHSHHYQQQSRRRRTSTHHNLPWYLQNLVLSQDQQDSVKLQTRTVESSTGAGKEGDEAVTSSSSSSTIDGISPPSSPKSEQDDQLIIRHYTGDFGVSFHNYKNHKREFIEQQQETPNTFSHHGNPSCSHCYRHNERRRQKTARWEYIHNLYQSDTMDTEHVLEFIPFQGTIVDLVKQNTLTISYTISQNESLRPNNNEKEIVMIWSSKTMWSISLCCLILISSLLFQRKKQQCSRFMDRLLLVTNHRKQQQRESIEQRSMEHNSIQLKSAEQKSINQEIKSFEKTELSNSDSPPDDFDALNIHAHDSPLSKNSSMFSVAIPAMAEFISKTGLNRQDSLRIATEQVLSAQRRDFEKKQEEKQKKLNRMKENVKMEMTRLRKCMVSTIIGYDMIFCLAIGCATRVITNNAHAIYYYLSVKRNAEDIFVDFCPLDVAYQWFVKDMCQCSDLSFSIPYNQSEMNQLSSSHCLYGGMFYVLNYFGMPSFVPFLFSVPIPIIRCMIGCMVKIILVGLLHRVLAVFHSKILHQCLNLFVFISLALRTAAGKTVIELIQGIIGFNIICCAVALYYRGGEPTWMFEQQSQDVNGTNHQDYERSIDRVSSTRKVLRISTCLGSITLALIRR
mmetsp:Transcript_1591/g.2905  ORF Transcript_1591/g.2905 Transcript_1591/m.2905 type:complete len:633 (-) Transcript_1591:729-2627(-)